MRLIPIVAAAAIGLFATAAVAQNMNTADPNSAPGASATGGKPAKRPSAAEIKKMDTTDPNSAPGASATGGKPKPASAAEVKKMDTTDPNSATTSGQSMGAKHKAKKKKTSNM